LRWASIPSENEIPEWIRDDLAFVHFNWQAPKVVSSNLESNINGKVERFKFTLAFAPRSLKA
jgi:hypothetical protein